MNRIPPVFWLFCILSILILGIVGCTAPARESSQSDNPAVQVDTLFTKDGVTVYRFMDGGRYIYFTRYNTAWQQSAGKSSYPMSVSSNGNEK